VVFLQVDRVAYTVPLAYEIHNRLAYFQYSKEAIDACKVNDLFDFLDKAADFRYIEDILEEAIWHA
jgi:hypothetical protein